MPIRDDSETVTRKGIAPWDVQMRTVYQPGQSKRRLHAIEVTYGLEPMQYQIINYVLDPITGHRIPIGAVARTPEGALHLALASKLPSAAYLGEVVLTAAKYAREKLSTFKTLEDLSQINRVLGPSVVRGPEHAMPAGVADPAAWLSSLLPQENTYDDE